MVLPRISYTQSSLDINELDVRLYYNDYEYIKTLIKGSFLALGQLQTIKHHSRFYMFVSSFADDINGRKFYLWAEVERKGFKPKLPCLVPASYLMLSMSGTNGRVTQTIIWKGELQGTINTISPGSRRVHLPTYKQYTTAASKLM